MRQAPDCSHPARSTSLTDHGARSEGGSNRTGSRESPQRNSRSRTKIMDVRNEMPGRLRSRRDGVTLPRPFYIDPGFFRLDMEMIWYRDWLFVGHDCELDKPGSFLTVQ